MFVVVAASPEHVHRIEVIRADGDAVTREHRAGGGALNRGKGESPVRVPPKHEPYEAVAEPADPIIKQHVVGARRRGVRTRRPVHKRPPVGAPP